jgi:hypothetical protein
MVTQTDERTAAVLAADGSCPRCGAPREATQEYCVECGMRLPIVSGKVPGLRRRWLRRFGWYPGDWFWGALLAFLVAAGGAAAAIVVTERERTERSRTIVATAPLTAVAEPATTQPNLANTATLPTPPEPTTRPATASGPPPPPNGRTVWPAARSGWTIVLISYPQQGGQKTALATATRAAERLPEVGVLDSGRFASLHPGYFVVFSGVYGARTGAEAALKTAKASGFSGAYVRPVSR